MAKRRSSVALTPKCRSGGDGGVRPGYRIRKRNPNSSETVIAVSTSLRRSPRLLAMHVSKSTGVLPSDCTATPLRVDGDRRRGLPVRLSTTETEGSQEEFTDSLQLSQKLDLKRCAELSSLSPIGRSATVRAAKCPHAGVASAASLEPCSSSRSATPTSTVEETGIADIPGEVFRVYQHRRKITALYEWQRECLSDRRLLDGSNMIISLPTGAGKTLIAEVLMLREAMVRKRSSLLVVPYIAIAQEKVRSLALFDECFQIWVEEYAASKGRLPPIKRRNHPSVYIATIEKANMLINSLIEHDRLSELGVCVVDELHMLGDGTRGGTIEQLLLKFIVKGSGQIVGISATLANLQQIANFLHASIFSTNFRPVQLTERVKIGNTLYRVDTGGKLIPEVELGENRLAARDPDGLVLLLQDVLPKKSVLIFCPTKQNCENVCELIARLVPKRMRELRRAERDAVIAELREEEDGRISATLQSGILAGVAFHHSGLTADERRIVESAFLDGVISVVCCTSTLAAGVNLPARRVIIKAPLVGREPLAKTQYTQMVGRAGRAGYDDTGDAVTIVRPGIEETRFRAMLSEPLAECQSALQMDEVLSAFLLDLISLRIAVCKDEVADVIRRSLFNMQCESAMSAVDEALARLLANEMIVVDKEGAYSATTLGAAAYSASIPPLEAQTISAALMDNLSKGIVLSSHFHLIFTIVPLDAVTDVNWDVFYDEYCLIPSAEQRLLGTMGIEEKQLVRFFVEHPKLKAGDPTMRLYIAFMLQRIWRQESFWDVSDRFKVTRGWLQSTLQQCCANASSIARFSEKVPSLWPLKHLLPDMVQHLRECAQPELIPLLALDCVKRGRARQLYDKGFKTVGAIAAADPAALTAAVEHLNRRQARTIVCSAQMLIRNQLAEKIEEMELMGASSMPDLMCELIKRM